jgi:hypothetical protein
VRRRTRRTLNNAAAAATIARKVRLLRPLIGNATLELSLGRGY